MAEKFVVVVGGVISGVGKGIATASIAKILTEYGYKTTAIKIDPYINCDAGTLRPTEHGEVWVTSDGGEIDQDLGNYERFIGEEIPKINNITTGQIYKNIIEKERNGEFLGETVQFIPHIPNEIVRRIVSASKDYDIAVIEVGGTIGDYENIPYLFALKSIERKLGNNSVGYVLITFLPIPNHVGEMKTKPTQQAIKLLSQHGILPDIILCRAKKELDQIRKKKIEIYANIPADMVISAPDISTIYKVPLNFEKENLGKKILKVMNLKPRKQCDWTQWNQKVSQILNPSKKIKIGIVCKYIETGYYYLEDSYISIKQSIEHAGAAFDCKAMINWISANCYEDNPNEIENLMDYDGIIVPGGFGSSGFEGKIAAITSARNNNIPFLGLCLGMQLAVVEFARNVLSLDDANTIENNPNTKYPMAILLPSQIEVMANSRYGASMRLGAYVANIKNNSIVYELYRKFGRLEKDIEMLNKLKKNPKNQFRIGIIPETEGISQVIERHRHRYEINPDYIEDLENAGMVFSGFHIPREDPSFSLMEFIELPSHPFFVATQAHPEFKSRLYDPSPLFLGFVEACLKKHYEK